MRIDAEMCIDEKTWAMRKREDLKLGARDGDATCSGRVRRRGGRDIPEGPRATRNDCPDESPGVYRRVGQDCRGRGNRIQKERLDSAGGDVVVMKRGCPIGRDRDGRMSCTRRGADGEMGGKGGSGAGRRAAVVVV